MAGRSKIIPLLLAWLLGALFIYAGVIKLIAPAAMMEDILAYQLLPYRLAYFAAYIIPALELATGAGLFLHTFRRESALILIVLMLGFTAGLASAWVRGLDINCGCFGSSDTPANYPLLLIRDILIITGLSILFTRKKKANSLALGD